jgi:uncharacterized protein (DUF1810 family)
MHVESDCLERYVAAQDGVYPSALEELKRGRKTGHWIWFILPQARGLGHSDMSVLYGIRDLEEARRYLSHPVLGPRYAECINVIHDWLVIRRYSAVELMGSSLDVIKLRSSLELFSSADPSCPRRAELLERL